jgi:hypothetical protein
MPPDRARSPLSTSFEFRERGVENTGIRIRWTARPFPAGGAPDMGYAHRIGLACVRRETHPTRHFFSMASCINLSARFLWRGCGASC